MSDMGDLFRDWKAHKRSLYVPCPHCNDLQPKRTPTNLLPQQRCKVCGYRDPRPYQDQKGAQHG